MKYNLLFLTLIVFTLEVSAQKGFIASVGAGKTSFTSNNELISQKNNSNNLLVGFDWVPYKSYLIGMEIQSNVADDLFFLEFNLKMGAIISGKNRIQFPLSLNINSFRFEEAGSGLRYGGVGYSARGAVRFYMTNNLSLEAGGETNLGFVDKIGSQEYEESIGSIYKKGFYLKAGYYFAKKN